MTDCSCKKRHATRDAAERSARHTADQVGLPRDEITAYYCPAHDCYHVGHTPGSRAQGRRRAPRLRGGLA